MFGIEFMTGAMFFAFVNLLIAFVFGYFLYRISQKIWIFSNSSDEDATLKIKKEIFFIGGIILYFIFFGSLTQPKLEINTLPNRDLIEYQEQQEEVIINTPPPRTENLEGFTPLKKE